MMKKNEHILRMLPYAKPFLFVDEILQIDANGAVGTFTFLPDLDFYRGHFKDFPVTPGVILTETMAQIGLVSLGIFLLDGITPKINSSFAMTSANIDFLMPVFPGEKVVVTSEKVYFRFNKLNCKVNMQNQHGEIVCKGIISGMLTHQADE